MDMDPVQQLDVPPRTPRHRPFDLVCLSHLRFDFVFQRPQHLMTRFAKEQRVFFVEEPMPDDGARTPWLDVRFTAGVVVATPRLPADVVSDAQKTLAAQKALIDSLLRRQRAHDYVLWYYTPTALPWTRHLRPIATIYDCMDELSGFANPPAGLAENEAELFKRADLVFTGGQSLYEAKTSRHPNVHCFPSSVDVAHFAQARRSKDDRPDQKHLARPRIGYAGVIDERMDLNLLAAVAAERPEWQFVMVGPVAKIEASALPRALNIHYLGMKSYDDLPAYLGSWDVGMLPFAHNAATRFISPTKTPEYIAAGLPVVSTSIRDVVRPYGASGLAAIADTPRDFVAAIERALVLDRTSWQRTADDLLRRSSWNRTADEMSALVRQAAAANAPAVAETGW